MADKKQSSDPTDPNQSAVEQATDQPLDVQAQAALAPQSTSTPTTDQKLMAQQIQQDAAGGRSAKLDETVPGGKYMLANGQFVDANGEPFKEEKQGNK